MNNLKQKSMENKEKELMEKMNEAGKPENVFILKLEHNGKNVVEEVKFSVDKFSFKTISSAKLYYKLLDFSREIINELESQDIKNKRFGGV